jgi:hypothetical protein
VGEWLRNRRTFVCATATDLIVAAAGHTPFVQKTPLAHLHESLYNAITAEVALAPDRALAVKHLKLDAVDGHQLLAQIYGAARINQKEEKHA